jgi:hypothetical protein
MNGNQIGGQEDDGGQGGPDIDLGQQPEGPSLGSIAPPEGGAGPPSGPMYPSVMLTGDQGLSKIPDTGRAHIKFHVSSRRQHTPEHGRHKGKQRHEVELHLHSIRPIRGYKKAESKSKRDPNETAMRKLLGDEEESEGEE